jgi:hypothetical protein
VSRQTTKEEAGRYLLGTLSDEERAGVEERYFSIDADFEEIEIAEEELIDRYVRGELSETDRNRFETNLAGLPRIAERVHFARMWKERLANSSANSIAASRAESRDVGGRQTSWWSNLFGLSAGSRTPRLAMAFSVLLILVGGIALFAGWMRLREQSRQLAAQQSALEQRQRELDKQAADLRAQADQLATQSPQPSPTETQTPPKPIQEQSPTASTPFVALTLSPGVTRSSGQGHVLRIPRGTKEVRLTLNLRDPDYSSYQVAISPVGGAPVFSSSSKARRTHSGAVLGVNVPANRLQRFDYLITLTGRTSTGTTEPVDEYSFRVIE